MQTESKNTELVLIGGSAGSLQVILEMIKNINEKLNFPIILVLHRKAQSTNILQTLLQQFISTEVVEIDDKTDIKKNKIYIVPADYHRFFVFK